MLLTSAQNPKIKSLRRLRERRERDETGLFLIEGYRELLRAVEAGWKIESLFFSPSLFLGNNENSLIERIKAPLYELPDYLFRNISYRDRPDGLIAIAYQKCLTLNDLKKTPSPFYIIAEAIEKPGNLGTILRSADGVGCDGVIVCDRCTDIYNPNVVRASTGTLFTQPVIEADSSTTIAFLKERGVTIVAAMPKAALNFTQADFRSPLAIVVGTEQLGLSEQWRQAASCQVSIPMKGAADSLNVAVATTLLLYEVLRQRDG